MMQEELEALAAVLRELGVDYVLVGGMAVELAGFSTGTEDVDFAVTMREFDRVLEELDRDARFRDVESLGTIGGAQFFTGARWLDVDFVNPKLFRGRKSGEDFIRYVKRYRSRDTLVGPVAHPAVTWYMRLIVPDWQVYVQKILRDIRAGVPEEILETALVIGKVLGVGEVLRPRVKKTRDFLLRTR
ncbi:MAG: hypothetical protein ACE5JE_02335 [Thermoplasmata archaeon]